MLDSTPVSVCHTHAVCSSLTTPSGWRGLDDDDNDIDDDDVDDEDDDVHAVRGKIRIVTGGIKT